MKKLSAARSICLLLLPMVFAVSGLFAPSHACAAQDATLVAPGQIASAMRSQFQALGDRLQKAGNERVVIQGSLTDATGDCPVALVFENGKKVRLDQNCASKTTLIFDASQKDKSTAKSAIVSSDSAGDDDLLETLVDDLPDNVAIGLGTSGAFDVIARKVPAGKNGFCDFYIASAVSQVKGGAPLTKRYCFDSVTHLLRTVEYRNAAGIDVTTTFGGWINMNGQLVPGQIKRVQGSSVVTINAQTAVTVSTANDKIFDKVTK